VTIALLWKIARLLQMPVTELVVDEGTENGYTPTKATVHVTV
jgi:hypothetical protein